MLGNVTPLGLFCVIVILLRIRVFIYSYIHSPHGLCWTMSPFQGYFVLSFICHSPHGLCWLISPRWGCFYDFRIVGVCSPVGAILYSVGRRPMNNASIHTHYSPVGAILYSVGRRPMNNASIHTHIIALKGRNYIYLSSYSIL